MPPLYQGHYACGAFHSLVVNWEGELYAWGSNTYGQVGDGTLEDRNRPVLIIESGVVAIAAGSSHSLCVTENGTVLAWGFNDEKVLGTPRSPKQLEPAVVISSGIIAVAAGHRHSMALTTDGEVLAWGSNLYGQLGTVSESFRTSPVRIVLPVAASAISAGWYHSVALLQDGSVLTWGFNTPDRTGFRHHGQPTQVINADVASISAGGVHTLALTSSGVALAWGGNEKGQLGDGTLTQQALPVRVATGIAHISAGAYHSVATDTSNYILIWGFSICGGAGPWEEAWKVAVQPQRVPMDINTFTFFSAVAGSGHNMAVSYDGEVYSWGGNQSGQIGNGTWNDKELPGLIFGPGSMKLRSHADIVNQMMGALPTDVKDATGTLGSAKRTLQSRAGTRPLLVAGRGQMEGSFGPPKLLLQAAGVGGGHSALFLSRDGRISPSTQMGPRTPGTPMRRSPNAERTAADKLSLLPTAR